MGEKIFKTRNARRHRRIMADYLVKYRIPGTETDVQISNITDISVGGIRFCSKRSFMEGTILHFEILITPLEQVIRPRGVVVRVRPAKEGDHYYIGVSFVELPQKERDVLKAFIEDTGVRIAEGDESEGELFKRHISLSFA